MAGLDEIMRHEISAHGPMRFDRFMELALYHPAHGYYAQPGGQTGRAGDFFTSVSVGPLFGRLLAAQSFQMWEQLGRPDPFWIVEQGAADGQLAEDILSWTAEAPGDFYRAVRYGIVEPSESARLWQSRRFGSQDAGEKIEWFQDLSSLERRKPVGVFLSNELVDAFPVRVVKWIEGTWRERYVEDSEAGWKETYSPIDDAELAAAVRDFPPIEGYTTEINLRARTWMGEVAQALERGYVLTIDYGFPASLYYAPFRAAGTLTGYRDHRRSGNSLADLGQQDITAHVDFTALVRAGEQAGLEALGLVDQQHFLMGIAESELSGEMDKRLGLAGNLPAWNTLTHPAHLGSRFLVLVQAKSAPAGLDGLRFARAGGWD